MSNSPDKAELLSKESFTMFYTMQARALATQFYPELNFTDQYAVEIQKKNLKDIPIYKTDKEFINSITTRSKIFDTIVWDFLEYNSNTIVISLGSGLCSRDLRFIDILNKNNHTWWNIDLECAIDIRNELLPKKSGIINKSCKDISTANWLDHIIINKNKSVFIIMEGVAPYLHQKKLEKLLINIFRKFKLNDITAYMLFDYCHPNYNYNNTNINKRCNKKVIFKSGFKNNEEILNLIPYINDIREHNYTSEYSKEYYLAEIDFKLKNNYEKPYHIIELNIHKGIKNTTSVNNLQFFAKEIFWNKKYAQYKLKNKQRLFISEDDYLIITEQEYNIVTSFLSNKNTENQNFQKDIYAVYLKNKLLDNHILIKKYNNNFLTPVYSNKKEVVFKNHQLIFLTEIKEKALLIQLIKNISFKKSTTIVFTDDYLNPRLESINSNHLKLQKNWILIKLAGNKIILGPLFTPSIANSPCYTCLSKLLWKNQPVIKWGNQNSYTSIVVPLRFSAKCLKKNLKLITLEIKKIVSNEKKHELITINLKTKKIQNHPVNQNKYCKTCGEPQKLKKLNSHPITLNSSIKINSFDGGFRTIHPKESLKKLENNISYLTGIVHPLKCISTNKDELSIYTTSFSKFPQKNGFVTNEDFIQFSLGKGISDDQSKMSAISESIERSNALYDGTEECIFALQEQLNAKVFYPEQLKCYSQNQYEEFQKDRECKHAVKKSPEGFGFHWTPVYSLLSQKKAYVPFTFCFSNTPFKDEEYIRFNSNGCAAGNTIEEAILQGFLELIERDAVAIWWYNKICRPAIDINDLDSFLLNKLQNTLNRDWDYWVLDLTNDFNIPVVAAIGRNKLSKEFRLGFGAHLDISLACCRALTELYQIIVINNQHQTKFKFQQISDQKFLRPNKKNSKNIFRNFQTINNNDIKDDIKFCISTAKNLDFDVFVCNTTRPYTPLHTVKVIIPGLNFIWPELGNQRLYNLPVKLGWLTRKLAEDELNSLKLFL